MLEIRWHGRGGQGAFTASKILGAAALSEGKFALAFPSFGPERRGAPIQAFTKIDDAPVQDRSALKKCDYIIFLDETLFDETVLGDLKEDGRIILNTASPEKYRHLSAIIPVDGNKVAGEIYKLPTVNTVMLGAFAGIGKSIRKESVCKMLADYLPEKIVEKNRAAVLTAAELSEKEVQLQKTGNGKKERLGMRYEYTDIAGI